MSNEIDEKTTDFEIEGTKYTLTETHLGDYAKFKSYLRSRRIKEIIEATADMVVADMGKAGMTEKGMTQGERIILIAEVQRQSITEEDAQRELSTFEGSIFMLHRSMTKYHPDLTLDDVTELFSNADPEKLEMAIAIQSGLDVVPAKNVKRAAKKV